MKHASFVRRCLAGIAVSVFLSSCSGKQSGVFSGGQPDPPAERQAAEILKTEKIPELIAEELSGNDESSEYRTEEGETVLFVAGSPERDKDGPGTGPIDFLRISRTCDLWILSYHVDSVRIGQPKKGKNGEWTCAVSAGLSGRIIRLEQVNGCILEKGFPVNWEDLPEARKGSFLEERDGFHEKRFDLCFLYSRAKDLPAVSESRRVRCFFVYSPADSEWHLKDRKEASVAKTIPSLGSVLADCSRENLISFYEQKGMTPSQNGNDLVFQDKAAAEYHARRDKGEIFDESIGKWVDHEEKKQNDTLIRQYEKYRKKKITLPEMIHTLDACKKAAVRGLILRDLNDKILQRIDFLNIPSEKNRRAMDSLAGDLKLFPSLSDDAKKRMDAFYDAASRYDEEMKRSSEFQKTYSDIRSRKKSADTRRKGRDQEIADLEKKKNGLFREIRPVNRTGADSVLKLLSAMDYRKEIPVPDAVVNAFFRENGIEEQPFDDRTYQKMLREYIAQETGRVFPVPLSQELAAVQKRIQKTFAVPKSGDVISVECTSGPFQGKSIRDTFYGLDGSSIRMGHRSISLRDLSPEDRMRFDPRGVEQLKAKYFEKRKRELVENREKFEASVRAEKADALRNEWAWSFGWLPERGNKYVSIRALAAKWHDLTLRQIALDRENAEDREAMKKDLAQFYEKLRNGDSFDRLFYALSVLEDPDSGGSSRERDEAFSILQDAAEHSVLAQSALGYAYLNGEMGLEKSPEKAFPLLKKAADQGAPGPIRKVAEMLRNGIGTGADREKAEKYRNALPVQEE